MTHDADNWGTLQSLFHLAEENPSADLDAGDCDDGLEGDFELFISCCEAAELLEPGEASFDAVALFMQCFV
jgi:hypothetical protein